jgi:hypothetical protein
MCSLSPFFMTPDEITTTLTQLFGNALQVKAPESWQVEADRLRLLVLLSEDQAWLRSLVTIAPASEAEPFLPQLMVANFDETQETRYALFEGILWGVFQHRRESLTPEDFEAAIGRLVRLHQRGLTASFNQMAESQVRQIVRIAKQQGQSLEATLQMLDRLYQEGVLGDIDQGAQQREDVMGAWRYQLERLWAEE